MALGKSIIVNKKNDKSLSNIISSNIVSWVYNVVAVVGIINLV